MQPAQKLKKIQAHTRWTQQELAIKLTVSHATLNSWINNKSQPRTAATHAITSLYYDVITPGTSDIGQPTSSQPPMQVFFTTPYAGKSRHQQAIDAILRAIRKGCSIVTPEDTQRYLAALQDLQQQGLNQKQAHYAFIRQGIASADAVIIEASQQDIRVGHELTLALLFHKPTLVLSQTTDYTEYITHDLLTGSVYMSPEEAVQQVQTFLNTATSGRAEASMQTLNMSSDSLHAMALAKLRRLAQQEGGQFGSWAREAETRPKKVAAEIEQTLGRLKQQPAWSVFAPVYNEDSPDYIQDGVASFIESLLAKHTTSKDSFLVEAACGTGALARRLVAKGFSNILGFDNSRPMLAEAYRLSTRHPAIRYQEAAIETLQLDKPADAIVWADYSSNFALSQQTLKAMIRQLMLNLKSDGLLIFDIRTLTGWQIDFYAQPVTTFATERFQRIWLNHQNQATGIISFDIFIRTRDIDGAWGAWRRESFEERMWQLATIRLMLASMPEISVEAIYGDDFRRLEPDDQEPNLAYVVIKLRTTNVRAIL